VDQNGRPLRGLPATSFPDCSSVALRRPSCLSAKTDVPVSVVIVFDKSGSMGRTRQLRAGSETVSQMVLGQRRSLLSSLSLTGWLSSPSSRLTKRDSRPALQATSHGNTRCSMRWNARPCWCGRRHNRGGHPGSLDGGETTAVSAKLACDGS